MFWEDQSSTLRQLLQFTISYYHASASIQVGTPTNLLSSYVMTLVGIQTRKTVSQPKLIWAGHMKLSNTHRDKFGEKIDSS